MAERDVEIVRRIFDALNSEDVDLVLSLTHPEFELAVPPALSAEPATYRGQEGMRRYLDSFGEIMEEIRIRGERFVDTASGVLVATSITARGRQTAIPVEQRSAGLWTVCDGQIRRVRVYTSMEEAIEALAGAQ